MNSWVIASWFLFALLLFCYFLWLGYHIKMRRSIDRVSFCGRGLGGDPSPYGCCPSPSKNIPPHVVPVNQKKIPPHAVQFQVIPLGLLWWDNPGGTSFYTLFHTYYHSMQLGSQSSKLVSVFNLRFRNKMFGGLKTT